MTHICVSNLTIIGSDKGLSPSRRQAIIWTNDGILLIETLGTHFSEILIEIQTFSFWKNRLKVSSGKWRPFCLGLNELSEWSGYIGCTHLSLILLLLCMIFGPDNVTLYASWCEPLRSNMQMCDEICKCKSLQDFLDICYTKQIY